MGFYHSSENPNQDRWEGTNIRWWRAWQTAQHRELVSDVWVAGDYFKDAFWCPESLSCLFF